MKQQYGFDSQGFMDYLQEEFSCFRGSKGFYLRNLTENLVEYALHRKNASKDQLGPFLADIMPELEFGEVAQFVGDVHLTSWGKKEREHWKNERRMQ